MPTQNDIKLGRRLQRLVKLPITQEKLADMVNLSVPYIGYLETGLKTISQNLKEIGKGIRSQSKRPYSY